MDLAVRVGDAQRVEVDERDPPDSAAAQRFSAPRPDAPFAENGEREQGGTCEPMLSCIEPDREKK